MEFPARCTFSMGSSTKICGKPLGTMLFTGSLKNSDHYEATQDLSSEHLQFVFLLKTLFPEKIWTLGKIVFFRSAILEALFLLKRGSCDT